MINGGFGPHLPMKTTFECVRSGNRVSFDNEDDIKQLRVHEGYKEIKNESQEAKQEIPLQVPNEVSGQEVLTVKRRGRPRTVS